MSLLELKFCFADPRLNLVKSSIFLDISIEC